jgi:hypothetical protein
VPPSRFYTKLWIWVPEKTSSGQFVNRGATCAQALSWSNLFGKLASERDKGYFRRLLGR